MFLYIDEEVAYWVSHPHMTYAFGRKHLWRYICDESEYINALDDVRRFGSQITDIVGPVSEQQKIVIKISHDVKFIPTPYVVMWYFVNHGFWNV